MQKGIQEMAEKCLREENFQVYLHRRSRKCATRNVKRRINEARGKGKGISCPSASQDSCLHLTGVKPDSQEGTVLTEAASGPALPTTWEMLSTSSSASTLPTSVKLCSLKAAKLWTRAYSSLAHLDRAYTMP